MLTLGLGRYSSLGYFAAIQAPGSAFAAAEEVAPRPSPMGAYRRGRGRKRVYAGRPGPNRGTGLGADLAIYREREIANLNAETYRNTPRDSSISRQVVRHVAKKQAKRSGPRDKDWRPLAKYIAQEWRAQQERAASNPQ
jgi:hypothetical protein